jgi:hypothetical protein
MNSVNAGNAVWTATTRDRIREVQDGLLSMAQWASESGADQPTTELLLHPYRDLLETLYERDMPLAKLADNSDLLLHIHGSAASGPSPRVSVLTRLLTQTRDQVTRLAKQFAGVTTLRVPPSLDMGFVGVAGGSLFLGFSTEATDGGDLTRQAVKAIADASWLVAQNGTIGELAQTITDPAARDMAVAAVRHLSPSGQIGISEIDILGRQVERSTSLTTETRRHARGIMTQRHAPTNEPVSFIGTVREMDLDASRFEIRNVEGQSEDVRCAHELEDDEVKRLVDKRVRVKGTAEYGVRKTVRLLWVDEVELLE